MKFDDVILGKYSFLHFHNLHLPQYMGSDGLIFRIGDLKMESMY